MYVHRSGRTARADTDGISIAIISPSDRSKYTTLCRALDKVGVDKYKIMFGIFQRPCILDVSSFSANSSTDIFMLVYSAIMLCAMSILATYMGYLICVLNGPLTHPVYRPILHS